MSLLLDGNGRRELRAILLAGFTRNKLERDVRKARTRLERELRTRRRDAERLIGRRVDAAKERVTALV